jgi:hypothetical protein
VKNIVRFAGFASLLLVLATALGPLAASAYAEVSATWTTSDGKRPGKQFGDAAVVPSAVDAGNQAIFKVLSGKRDSNGGGLECLNDGRVPTNSDEPRANFFFTAGTDGGRILIDLGQPADVLQLNTFSWHVGSRAPQVYELFADDPTVKDFDVKRAKDGDPKEAGWKRLAAVDTRAAGNKEPGGQYAACIKDSADGVLAHCRYLLLVISRTENDDPFGNTFFSEIDVIDGKEHPPAATPAAAKPDVLEVADGKYRIEFDCSDVAEIKPWVDEKLKPVCAEWYPKIVELLPSEGYDAPRRFSITFHSDMEGVAYTERTEAGLEVHCAAPWFLKNLEGEAAGAVVHEMVHVVQQYGRTRGGQPNPGWLVEGLADYIRWFLYEPERLRPKVNPRRAKYTDSYRTTGAFLNYIVEKHDADAVKKLNAAMREGKFHDGLWQEYTDKTADELWAEYVKTLKN